MDVEETVEETIREADTDELELALRGEDSAVNRLVGIAMSVCGGRHDPSEVVDEMRSQLRDIGDEEPPWEIRTYMRTDTEALSERLANVADGSPLMDRSDLPMVVGQVGVCLDLTINESGEIVDVELEPSGVWN